MGFSSWMGWTCPGGAFLGGTLCHNVRLNQQTNPLISTITRVAFPDAFKMRRLWDPHHHPRPHIRTGNRLRPHTGHNSIVGPRPGSAPRSFPRHSHHTTAHSPPGSPWPPPLIEVAFIPLPVPSDGLGPTAPAVRSRGRVFIGQATCQSPFLNRGLLLSRFDAIPPDLAVQGPSIDPQNGRCPDLVPPGALQGFLNVYPFQILQG